MTKLEKKLQELGYCQYIDMHNIYIKKVCFLHYIAIFTDNIENSRVWTKKQLYYNEKDIDLLTQAVKKMQKDLEELKNVKN